MHLDCVLSHVSIFLRWFVVIVLPSHVLHCCAPLCSCFGADVFRDVTTTMSCLGENVQMWSNVIVL